MRIIYLEYIRLLPIDKDIKLASKGGAVKFTRSFNRYEGFEHHNARASLAGVGEQANVANGNHRLRKSHNAIYGTLISSPFMAVVQPDKRPDYWERNEGNQNRRSDYGSLSKIIPTRSSEFEGVREERA